jgi:hypothetical protein
MVVDLGTGVELAGIHGPDTLIDRAINDPGPFGIAAAGVLIEPHSAEPIVISLFRKAEWHDGRAVSVAWTAAITGPDLSPRDTVTTETCDALEDHVDRLVTLEVGNLLSPPTLDPPQRTVGSPLYTVWGRSRNSTGGGQITRVVTSAGPIAEWASTLGEIVADCAARAEGELGG